MNWTCCYRLVMVIMMVVLIMAFFPSPAPRHPGPTSSNSLFCKQDGQQVGMEITDVVMGITDVVMGIINVVMGISDVRGLLMLS